MISEQSNYNKIKQAIVEAIAFFDLFDYPLTAREIWNNLPVKCDLQALETAICEMARAKKIETENDYFFLANRKKIIETRQERKICAERKFKRARLVAKLFQPIPWIKMIAVGNIIGDGNLKDESDIDFFIVAEKNRIWLARFFCAGMAKLLGLRPKENSARDKICLSFFVSEDNLNLKNLMLSKKISQNRKNDNKNELRVTRYALCDCDCDIYFIYWLAGLELIYNYDQTFEKFMAANDWLKDLLPNLPKRQADSAARADGKNGFRTAESSRRDSAAAQFYHQAINLLFGGLEKRIGRLQYRLLPRNLKEMINDKYTNVVVNDRILKLHVNDRREEYREAWVKKISGII